MRILVTPRSMTAAGLHSVPELEPLRRRGWELVGSTPGHLPTEDELIELLPEIDGWLAGVEKISARSIAGAPRLRVISRNGVGADAVDVSAAEAAGVTIALARGANSRGVAELALALSLACLRDLPRSNETMHAGKWERSLGREMPDLTFGLVGFGAIGKLVARFATAMDARVLAFDPFTSIEGAESASLKQIFASADVISLHSPPPADGSALVSRELLDEIRSGTILVNTARSALVDDEAVLEALESGRLAAYAVDAFDAEPPELTPLLRHPHTLMTPHLGGYTGASTRRATEQSVANLIATLEG
jgi:D-3-phosphoglycerate dehydrogenase